MYLVLTPHCCVVLCVPRFSVHSISSLSFPVFLLPCFWFRFFLYEMFEFSNSNKAAFFCSSLWVKSLAFRSYLSLPHSATWQNGVSMKYTQQTFLRILRDSQGSRESRSSPGSGHQDFLLSHASTGTVAATLCPIFTFTAVVLSSCYGVAWGGQHNLTKVHRSCYAVLQPSLHHMSEFALPCHVLSTPPLPHCCQEYGRRMRNHSPPLRHCLFPCTVFQEEVTSAPPTLITLGGT